MQVFVPSSKSFEECVRVLDNKRLFKQMLEVSQLLDAMADKPDAERQTTNGLEEPSWLYIAWKHHSRALAAYAMACVQECRKRNLKTETLAPRIAAYFEEKYELPAWWGDEKVHSSHRARLLTKDYDYYSKLGWPEAEWDDLSSSEYQWPIWLEGSTTDYRLEIRKAKAK